jgi:hypothetical protein
MTPRFLRILAAMTTALVVALAVARYVDPLPEGLDGTYFRRADLAGIPARSGLAGEPSTELLDSVWHGSPPEVFSATWAGSFLALRSGTYSFGTASDDGSSLYVDGREVVDNGGRHSTQLVTGSVELTRGVHAIYITYAQEGGFHHLDVLWGRDAASLAPLDSWALTTRHPSFSQFLLSAAIRRALPLAAWLWLLSLVAVGGRTLWPDVRARVRLPDAATLTAHVRSFAKGQAFIVGLIAVAGVAIRLLYLQRMLVVGYALKGQPGWWVDPDGYIASAQTLTATGHWAWTLDAIGCCLGLNRVAMPPGYPVFLSLLALGHASGPPPLAVAVVNCLLGGVEVVSMYILARSLHNARAGLIAAVLSALWFPNITSVTFMAQERLFLPLMLAGLAAIASCLTRRERPRAFLLSGGLWAAAALTRPQPLYFLPLILLVIATWDGERRWRFKGLAAYAIGFGVPVAVYIAYISMAQGTLVLIDNHAAIKEAPSLNVDQQAVGHFTTMVQVLLVRSLRDWQQTLSVARGMFHLYGPTWLALHGTSVSAATAPWTAWTSHIWLDLLFAILAIAAPVGLAVARQPRLAALLAAWVLLVIGISALTGFAGGRYRTPIEGVVICGASAAAARQWRRPSRAVLASGIAAALLLAMTILPQLPASFAARAPIRRVHAAQPVRSP